MSLTPQEQFKKFLTEAKDVLILIPENPSADAVGSAWSLYQLLDKKQALATIAFSNHLSHKFEFLPKPERIVPEISGARDFVLSFDTNRNKIVNIRHEEVNGKFVIYLTPEHGAIDPRDFSFILAKFKYDLVIVIDVPDLEKLGKIYTSNPDLFFEVPLINIDHRSDNDNFGQINLVDVTASSCSEILAKYIEQYEPAFLDKTIATSLLTGIIGGTDSFQKKNTTPKTLVIASTLMDKGADQQEIIRWLYKTQPLHILKLWGRAMAKINWDDSSKLIWSIISLDDFVQSRSNPEDLPVILEKLQENFSDARIFMTVNNDTPTSSRTLIKTINNELLKSIYLKLGGEIKRGMVELKIDNGNLVEVGKAIVEKIKQL